VLEVLKPSAQYKLGGLLRPLSADRDGEVLPATTAIKRTPATKGLDINDRANALCQPAPRDEARAQSALASADDTDWHRVACECEAHGAFLNLRAQKFVADMVTWTRRATLTKRQQAWLLIILNKVRHG
jgi:hypothetical protein